MRVSPWSFLQVIGNVDDDALKPMGAAPVKQSRLDQHEDWLWSKAATTWQG